MTKKVCVVSSTRADYGLLYPLIKRLSEDKDITLQLVVTGTHLKEEFGLTKNEIIEDGFTKFTEVPIIDKSNDSSEIFANTITGFSCVFKELKPDLVVVLGDRFEILAVSSVTLLLGIPLAHISGGDVTFGAIDDACRHAITKMANLHFAGNSQMRGRIIQMGEDPQVAYDVGELGVENVLNEKLWSMDQINKSLKTDFKKGGYVVVTYHPETILDVSPLDQIKVVLDVILSHPEFDYIITKSNVDHGGDEINKYIESTVKGHKNIIFVASLGRVRYLSCVKNSAFVLGNSSSGLIEVPYLGVPTINIGNRQQGRSQEVTTINAELTTKSIEMAFKKAVSGEFRKNMANLSYVYGNGDTSVKIVAKIKEYLSGNVTKKKIFYTEGE